MDIRTKDGINRTVVKPNGSSRDASKSQIEHKLCHLRISEGVKNPCYGQILLGRGGKAPLFPLRRNLLNSFLGEKYCFFHQGFFELCLLPGIVVAQATQRLNTMLGGYQLMHFFVTGVFDAFPVGISHQHNKILSIPT